jgi:UDP-N-acetylmuramoylalanine--D-glutamate ligase
MKVAIVGYGIEGQSAYRYWSKQHADITICDRNDQLDLPKDAASQLGEGYLKDLDRFDVIMRTAGMHPHIILDANPGVGPKVTTVINEFMRVCPAPIVGITGTKGKGTTSTLIFKILQAAGFTAHLGGNIGHSPFDFISDVKKDDYVVLELSSFQLEDATHSPHVAVCLMVVPEHLNWHADLEEYKNAKSNIFRFQEIDDIAVYNALSNNSRDIAAFSGAQTIVPYGVPAGGRQHLGKEVSVYVKDDRIFYEDTEICGTGDVALIGRHNLENICAAIAATWKLINGNTAAIKKVVKSFSGLEHRLEFVKYYNGVRFFDDSFSTTPETAIAAIQAFEEPKVLILGGSDKGVSFEALAEAVTNNNVRQVLAIGTMGPVIAEALLKRGFQAISNDQLDTMQAIVKVACKVARTGDVVLLSPACASFDMFKDYKDRGDQFKRAVRNLK